MALPVQLVDLFDRVLGASWLAPLRVSFFSEGAGRFSSPVSFTATPLAGGRIHLSGSVPTITNGSEILSVKTYSPGGALNGEYYPCEQTPFTWDAVRSDLLVGGVKEWANVRAIRVEIEAEHRGHDVSTNSTQVWPLTQPRPQQDSPQQSASSLPNGTTHKYFDVEQGERVTFRILDTPGVAGDNAYTIHTSQLNDTTSEGSADYQDRTDEYTPWAEITSAMIAAKSADGVIEIIGFQAKRFRITCERANDGANSDGGYQLDAMWS